MWLYDLPMSVGLPLFIVLVVGGSCVILLVLRTWVFRVAPQGEEWDRVLSYAVGAYGVFYGVTLALIAAAAYGNFTEVDGVVLRSRRRWHPSIERLRCSPIRRATSCRTRSCSTRAT